MSKGNAGDGKGGGGSKGAGGGSRPAGGQGSPNPNWPSKTGQPSGGGRGNNPPSK
jgi:hypothetical protein